MQPSDTSAGSEQPAAPAPAMSPPIDEAPPPSWARYLGGLVVVLATAGYLLGFVDRFCIPHDEGLIGQTAERMRFGELPHRDFDETYTGGVAALHALGQQWLGTNVSSSRWILYGASLLFVVAVYAIALRAVRPWAAVLVAATCLVWSVPNYFAALPSWYNLFCATFGVWALLRYVESDQVRWLVLAGLFGGLGMLAKIVGLYFVAAGLLFCAYREQSLSVTRNGPEARRSSAYLGLLSAAAALFSVMLVLLVRKQWSTMVALHFVLPGAALALLLVVNEWRVGRGAFGQRLNAALGMIGPLALGVALPVVLWMLPYAASDSLGDLFRGLFVLPARRLDSVTFSLPRPEKLLYVGPLAMMLVLGFFRVGILQRLLGSVAILGLLVCVVRGESPNAYAPVWFSVRLAGPIVVLLACWGLWRADRDGLSPVRRQQLFAVAGSSALLSLLQFPFAHPIYFCYTAPLLWLAALFAITSQPHAPRWFFFLSMLLYLGFAVGWMNTSHSFTLGRKYQPDLCDAEFVFPRGGLRVFKMFADTYNYLIPEIQSRSRYGSYIYATPDCPEVYFFSGRRNPTRTLYETFDEPEGKTERIARLLEEKQVDVVVVNRRPEFSGSPPADLLEILTQRYPESRDFGKFTLRWRPPSQPPSLPSPVP